MVAPRVRSKWGPLHILRNGSVTTEELEAVGYRDAASAARDVRDAGIPLVTGEARSKTGGRTGRYTLGRAKDIVDGRFNGRTVIPKSVREGNYLDDKHGT